MKIRMTEYFKGRNQPSLTINKEYKVGEAVSEKLAEWLVNNRKAVWVDEPVPVKPEPVEEPEKVEPEPEQEKPVRVRSKRRSGKK